MTLRGFHLEAGLSSELLITSQVQTNGPSVCGKAARVMEKDNLIYGDSLKEPNRWSSAKDDGVEPGDHPLVSEGCKQSAD